MTFDIDKSDWDDSIAVQLAAIKKWQVEEMGNTCTICHGSNAYTMCDACGWWGRVPPETRGGVTTAASKIPDAVDSPDRPAPDGCSDDNDCNDCDSYGDCDGCND